MIFGNSLKSAPSVLPSDTVTIFDRVVPKDRFMLAGIVIVVAAAAGCAVPLDALRPVDEGGVGERGLGDARRSLAEPPGGHEHHARERRRRRARASSSRRSITLDAQTLAFQVVPALGAALLAGFTSFFIACFAGLAIGVVQSLLDLLGDAELVPDRHGGRADPGAVRAVRLPRHRGRAVPARGEPARPRRARREAASGRARGRSGCSGRRRSPRSSAWSR